MSATSSALSEYDQLRMVFGGTGLADLREVIPADRSYSEAATYPMLLSLGVNVAARIYGSQRNALANLAQGSVWSEITRRYRERFGNDIAIPNRPPSARQQDAFIAHLAHRPKLLAALSQQFTLSALGQAQHLGNFPYVPDPDFVHLDARNVVMGDGTFYKPFSDVHPDIDALTAEFKFAGSRSTGKRGPRMQTVYTDGSADEKVAVGINHVSLLTWTRSGWIVLANAQALGAEIFAAEQVIESVQPVLGDRLHGIAWDRAITGFHVEWYMAQHRTLVINKSVARGTQIRTFEGGYTPLLLDPSKAVKKYRDPDALLPLGVTVYPTTKGFDVVNGKVLPYKHTRLAGCTHDLWVDDGTLVDVIYKDNHYWKQADARPESAHAQRGPHGAWQLATTWRLPCPDTPGGEHRFPTLWKPRLGKSQAHLPYQRALSELRTLPRSDKDSFNPIHGLRNHTESYNAWAKAHLGTGVQRGRAMRLHPQAQLLDHLCIGLLANAITMWRDRHFAR